MPLSAAFHFFSPFHSKKKYHIQPLSPIHFFLLFHIFLFSFLFHSPVNSLSTLIFVILLLRLKYNKKSDDLIAKLTSRINEDLFGNNKWMSKILEMRGFWMSYYSKYLIINSVKSTIQQGKTL